LLWQTSPTPPKKQTKPRKKPTDTAHFKPDDSFRQPIKSKTKTNCGVRALFPCFDASYLYFLHVLSAWYSAALFVISWSNYSTENRSTNQQNIAENNFCLTTTIFR